MAQRRHHNNKRQKPHIAAPHAARPPVAAYERKAPVTYGKPVILLEDDQKVTFIYSAGQWTRHEKTIAECRVDCQVKELSQKINGMTRYEVCSPLATTA
jgi:hypothetical protein